MKCPKCGAELPKNAAACPSCGARIGKKKLPLWATILITVVLVALVAAAFAVLLYTNNKKSKTQAEQQNTNAVGQTTEATSGQNKPTESTGTTGSDSKPGTSTAETGTSVLPYTPAEGSYTYPSARVSEEMLEQVTAKVGDWELTNRQLPYYYWYGIQNFYSNYSDYLAGYLDLSVPLDEQYYDSENKITWQSYFLDQAMNDFQYYAAMNQAATKAGFNLPETYETYLASLLDAMESAAVNYGYKDLSSYLQAFFSPYATPEGYLEFTRTYLTVNAYTAELQQSIASGMTEEDVQDYFTENEDLFASMGVAQDGTRLVSVRHILLMPEDTESDADWADAEQTAESIYNAWKNNPTEDYFIQMANTYSEDPGSSSNGGLYENVYPGQMVAAFNDWCFDPERQTGDSGIVKTEYGYHIMYFVDHGDEFWRYAAQNYLMSDRYTETENSILESYPLETNYDNVVLVDPVGMY